MAGIPELHPPLLGGGGESFVRAILGKWRMQRIAAGAEALALRVGPHIARDIGVGFPPQRPVLSCLNAVR